MIITYFTIMFITLKKLKKCKVVSFDRSGIYIIPEYQYKKYTHSRPFIVYIAITHSLFYTHAIIICFSFSFMNVIAFITKIIMEIISVQILQSYKGRLTDYYELYNKV